MTLRLRGSKTELEEMGEDVSDMATTTSQLQAKLLALTGGKVDIMLDANTFKSSTQILREMSAAFEDMTDIQRASALELMGGKRQANILSALIENFDTVESAIEASSESAGSAMRENERWMDSINGKVQQFNNATQTMWQNAIGSEVVKDFVDLGTELVKIVDKLGLVKTTIFGIMTYMSILKKEKIDFAEILGIHSIKGGKGQWTFGKEGTSRYIKELAPKVGAVVTKPFGAIVKKTQLGDLVEPIFDDADEIEDAVQKYADTISDGFKDNIKVDTSVIDKEIDEVQEKLVVAREKLKDANSKDWQYYKNQGSYAPAKERDNNIKNAKSEVGALEKKLSNLETRRDNLVKSTLDVAYKDLENNKASVEQYRSMLGSLEKFNNVELKMPDMSESDLANVMDTINAKTAEGQGELLKYFNTLGDGNEALQAYIASLNGGNASLGGFDEFLKTHNAQVQASGIKAKAAAVGHQLLNAAISFGASILISVAIDAIMSWVNAAQEMAEAAEDAMEAYRSTTNTLRDHKKTLDEIEDEYPKLAKGVDNLGRNVSLTTEEYERYNDITNQIADMFPHLISGYTEEGNAILKVKGNVDALKQAYEEEARAARDAVLAESKSVVKSSHNTIKKSEKWFNPMGGVLNDGMIDVDSDGYWKSLGKWAGENISLGLWQADASSTQIHNLSKYIEGDESALGKEDISRLLQTLKDAGADVGYFELRSGDKAALDRIIEENRDTVQSIINVVDSEISAAASNNRSIIDAYLGNNTEYSKLGDGVKSTIQRVVQNLDDEFVTSFESNKELFSWVENNLVGKFRDLDADAKKDIQFGFDLQTKFNDGSVPVAEYEAEINRIIGLIDLLDLENEDEVIKSFRIAFGVDDDGKIDVAKQNVAKNLLQDQYDDKVGELTKSELDIIDKLEIPEGTLLTWDELKDKIKDAKAMAWSAGKEFDKISEEIDSVQDAYSTLSNAVAEYNSNGFLSLDSLQALLSLEPEYLACLQMENGQLSINRQAMQNLVQARLAESKATVIQSAMDQLHALSARTEADAVTDSATAASNAVGGLGSYANALGEVSQDALVAAGAVTAFNAAVAGAEANEFVDQSEIDAILNSMNTSLAMIDELGANLSTNFNTVMGGDGGDGSIVDSVRKKYEREITNKDNQQTYLQNEIDRLQAQNDAVSRSYYEEQIDLEQEKLALYEQERKALLKLDMTDEVASALWEVEHAIQESTLRMVEFRQSIIDLYVDAFDKVIGAYDNSDDFFSDQQNYIDKAQELMELQGGTKTAGGINEQINLENKKMQDNLAELSVLRQAFAYAMTNGLEVGSEEWVNMQDEIRATEEAILDNKIAIEQYREELKQLAVDAFETVREAFGNKDNFLSNQQDYIQGYADLLEAYGIDVPAEVYQKLIEIEGQRRDNFVKDLADSKNGLDKLATTLFNNAAKSNPAMESWTEQQKQAWLFTQKEYVDAYNTMTETEGKIQDCDIATAGWIKTMRELDFEKFDRFISRLKDIHTSIGNINSLFDDEDVANEDGTWTKEGMTSLGLNVQGMVQSQQEAQMYAEELAKHGTTYEEYLNNLSEEDRKTAMSEKEWYDRLQDLTAGQWDAIKTTEDYKDAIVDMEEARIDAIEEGLNKEIEAYQELIETQKEQLDAERDLYEFNKKVKNQKRELSEIDRRIASLSGSTADADIAELRKLQKERRDLQEGLDDTYYQHSKDSQSKALDDELEMFQKIREDYIEELRETLEDTATVIANAMAEALANADIVYEGLTDAADEYGFTAPNALMAPWIAGKASAEEFKTTATDSISGLIGESGILTVFGSDETKALVTSVFGAGTAASEAFKQSVETTISGIKTTVENSTSGLTSNFGYPWEETTKEGGPIATFNKDVADAVNGAVNIAKEKAQGMYDQLSKPWLDMTKELGPLDTFNSGVEGALNAAEQRVKQHVQTVNSEYASIQTPDYTGTGGTGGDGDVGDGNDGANPAVKQLQEILNEAFPGINIAEDGKIGPATQAAIKTAQQHINKYFKEKVVEPDGIYGNKTRNAFLRYLNAKIASWKNAGGSSAVGQGVRVFEGFKKTLPAAFAKGTMGTDRDQWAITDESWIGEEITLAAGKNGQLQYLKKGSAVMPADISANLIEWGKLNPNMFNAGVSPNINMISNAISKPEFNITFDSLIRAENITEETLPAVRKLVTQELNRFTKELNYALKGKGAR